MASSPTVTAGAAGVDACFDTAGTADSSIAALHDRTNSLLARIVHLECTINATADNKRAGYLGHLSHATESHTEPWETSFPPGCARFSIADAADSSMSSDAFEDFADSYEFLQLLDAPVHRRALSDSCLPSNLCEQQDTHPVCAADAPAHTLAELHTLVENMIPPIISPFMENIVHMMGQSIQEQCN